MVDKLFKSLSIGLGLEGHELKEAAGGDDLIHLLKINYYPPCPSPDLVLGVPPHSDMSYITILVPNEVQGLQASRDGRWYDVRYVPNALVIHIGDQIEVLIIYLAAFLLKNKNSFFFFLFFLAGNCTYFRFRDQMSTNYFWFLPYGTFYCTNCDCYFAEIDLLIFFYPHA